VYTYIGVIAQVLNDGLPRAAWLIIGDKSNRTISSRIGISYSLILAQTILGLLMTIVFIAAAESLAAAFVPIEVRASSLTYVRISSIEALSSALITAVSACTRALDQPDVPVVIGIVQFTVNIVLDMLLISKFHVGSFNPTVNTQALTQMACNMSAAVAGLVYFIYISIKAQRQATSSSDSAKPSFGALMKLVKPSVYTFSESAVRNAIYLWLVSRIVLMGETYATAWGIFNTIRWGLIMVPVQALEASTLTFVGHNWGQWRTRVGSHAKRAKATRSDVRGMPFSG
jgi:Na+-driven multidrug efflux pump